MFAKRNYSREYTSLRWSKNGRMVFMIFFIKQLNKMARLNRLEQRAPSNQNLALLRYVLPGCV